MVEMMTVMVMVMVAAKYYRLFINKSAKELRSVNSQVPFTALFAETIVSTSVCTKLSESSLHCSEESR